VIIEGLVVVLKAFLSFVVGLFPTSNPPGWLINASGTLQSVWDAASGLGAWIPFALAGQVIAAVLACMTLGLGIKLIRVVVSLFTGGGGSAA